MAYSTNDDVPVNVENKDKLRNSIDLIPMYFRTEANRKFFGATVDTLISKGQLKRLNGFIGSRNAKNAKPDDFYIPEPTKNRRHYNLFPGAVIRNQITRNPEWSGTYDDLVNQLDFFGAKTNDHSRLFESDYFTWDPHVDLDKFVNYRQYYWLPSGPSPVTITGFLTGTTSTYSVVNSGSSSYVFTPNGFTNNPIITLHRGATYRFEINAPGHPFYIKTARTTGTDEVYSTGVQNNGAESGTIIFTVPLDAPDNLFYACENHQEMQGILEIKNAEDEVEINVEKEIVGKVNFTSANSVEFTNGLKVRFTGTVVPEKYQNKNWYVEGVGSSIELIPEDELDTPETYTQNFDFEFDVEDFDETPFDDVSNYPTSPEYITIKRNSLDKNPWSRYNRWFHKDVIEKIAGYNNTTILLDENFRAKRPIIEFDASLQLHNFATQGLGNVDLIDTQTTDAMSDVEGSIGYYVDETLLQSGMRVIFNADPDITVKGKIYEVSFETFQGKKYLHLNEVDVPVQGQGVVTVQGKSNKGSSWYFNGTEWVKGQQKTMLNQAPLFDLFDKNGNSFSNETVYPLTTFAGNNIVSYQQGEGNNDTVLGFPITYQNIANVGDILFDFNWDKDNFNYNTTTVVDCSSGFVRKNKSISEYEYTSGWKTVENATLKQKVLQVNDIINATNQIQVTAINNAKDYFETLDVTLEYNSDIYKKGRDFTLQLIDNNLFLVTNKTIPNNTRITLRMSGTDVVANENGHYEPPANLVNNGENNDLNQFTLGSIGDHFRTIFLNDERLLGELNGITNARDIPNIVSKGLRFLKHKGSMVNSIFSLVDKDSNIIKAFRDNALKYNLFKEQFLQKAVELGLQDTVRENVDEILYNLSQNKNITDPHYYTDMAGFGRTVNVLQYTINTSLQKIFGIADNFSMTTISDRSVYVYLNEVQLVHNIDYVFDAVDNSVEIKRDLSVGDKIVIADYDTTGNIIPFTPTKLGLYPKFQPKIYTDNTYAIPQKVIEGHDGSITVAYNDFRDDLLLELEKRIYNNIKVNYNPEVFDINNQMPSAFRQTDYTRKEFNDVLRNDFGYWANLYDVDYITNNAYDETNLFSYNYGRMVDDKNNKILPAYWRGIYKLYYDTDRPHTNPWEMLGFSEKPTWWEDEYGPAPYTSGNLLLWEDLEKGLIKDPNNTKINSKYSRPGLTKYIPVDEYGELRDPFATNVAQKFVSPAVDNDFVFGDHAPAETAWQRSSWYPFHIQVAMILLKPAQYLGTLFDVSQNEIVFDSLKYKDTGKIFDLSFVKINDQKYNNVRYKGLGYHAVITDYIKSQGRDLDSYEFSLKNLSLDVVYKLGGFASKNKLRILLENNTPNSETNSVFLPAENYRIQLRTSNPISKAIISGVIVEKVNNGYLIRGYDKYTPYFNYNKAISSQNDIRIDVGGVSADFVVWQPSKFYGIGQLVQFEENYYRAKENHTSSTEFENEKWAGLPSLPTSGGAAVTKPTKFESSVSELPYNSILNTAQDVFNFLLGYGKYLESKGFVFDEYLSELKQVQNWEYSGREFLFWTTQGWAVGSVITLAPFAQKLVFSFQNGQVDNVLDSFYEYSLLNSKGLALPTSNFATTRQSGKFSLRTRDTQEGIYYAQLNLVQKEHVIVFDDKSVFGDIIYDQESGYRQERIKISGFKTDEWDGDLYSPGFVFDEAIVVDWNQFVDYNLGDVVKYKNKYYSAKRFTPGTSTFETDSWVYLGNMPVAELYANFDYKVDGFQDFYSLESETFDSTKTALAQHLIGYQKRPYLDNLVKDETAQYKFYQGFIKEKGTKNAVDKIQRFTIDNVPTNIEYEEEWGFKVGSLGSYSTINEIEFPLDEKLNVENPQAIEFVNSRTTELSSSNIIKLLPSDIPVKPNNFNVNIWPTLTIDPDQGQTVDLYQKLPLAGYPRIDDVTLTLLNYDELFTNENIVNLNTGDTIWIARDVNTDWNVYRVQPLGVRIINPELAVAQEAGSSLYTVNTDKPHRLSPGQLVVLKNFDSQVNGVYNVVSVTGLTTFVIDIGETGITLTDDSSTGEIFELSSVRVTETDLINNVKLLDQFEKGEKLWIDNNGSNLWTVYEKTDAYTERKWGSVNQVEEQRFGFNITANKNGRLIAVSGPKFGDEGQVYILRRDTNTGITNLKGAQGFAVSDNISDNLIDGASPQFGYSLSIAPNEQRLVAGAPYADHFKAVDDSSRNGFFVSEGDFNATPQPYVKQGVVKLTKLDTADGLFKNEYIIASHEPKNNEYFGFSVKLGNTKLAVGAPGHLDNKGRVYFYDYKIQADGSTLDWDLDSDTGYLEISSTDATLDGNSGDEFGFSIDASDDMTILAVSAPGREVWQQAGDSSKNNGEVRIYTLGSNNVYTQKQILNANTLSNIELGDRFGYQVKFSSNGNDLFVSAPFSDVANTNSGAVYYFTKQTDGTYSLAQIITSPDQIKEERFGITVSVNSAGNDLAIYSESGDTQTSMTTDVYKEAFVDSYTRFGNNYVNDPQSGFNEVATTFDGNSTKFTDESPSSGAVYSYKKLNTRFVFGQKLTSGTVESFDNFGKGLEVVDQGILVGSPYNNVDNNNTGALFVYDRLSTSGWDEKRKQGDLTNPWLINKTFTYSLSGNKVKDFVETIDPVKGKIPYIAESEIRFKSDVDPAVYSASDRSDVGINSSVNWTDDHLGEVWWDLSSVKFLWYEQGDTEYRANNWGGLFPGSSIDIYEWVETDLLPSEWTEVADTTEGVALGFSGTPKYNDNTVSVKRIYNANTGNFTTRYYYWVRNSVIVPEVDFRRLPCSEVSNIITDPDAYGIKSLQLLSPNSISVSNLKTTLADNDVHLSVQYRTVETDLPEHNEWLILREKQQAKIENSLLNKKLFDSLVGFDDQGNAVPDPQLPVQRKYGIQIRPRQSMFKNRFQALKTVVDYANSIMNENRIVDTRNITKLFSKDPIPAISTGKYDVALDDFEDTTTIGTQDLRQASITLSLTNGKVSKVTIDNKGYGYRIAPEVQITGDGEGVKLQTSINSNGEVVDVEIVKAGKNYNTITARIRPFKVLIRADETANNYWSLYEWNINTKLWNRTQTQTYDVSRFWSYKDYVVPGFSTDVIVDYKLEAPYQLDTITPDVGNIIEIDNAGDGNKMYLEAVSGEGSFSYGFDLKYKANSTLQINSNLYDYSQLNFGFAGAENFDINLFDEQPIQETRLLLEVLKEDIFVDDLKQAYNTLFFNCVKYALSEQNFLDWAFKTSFINLKNNIGGFGRQLVYGSDNVSLIENYIKEVKPYRTNIREYTIRYDDLEDSYNGVTDFDVPSVYNKITQKFETVKITNPLIAVDPWKQWFDNYKFTVGNVIVSDPGSGYTQKPIVIISGGRDNKTDILQTEQYDSIVDFDYDATYFYLSSSSVPLHSFDSAGVQSQSFVFRIPRTPIIAETKQSTADSEAIGVATNGVVFYNPNSSVTEKRNGTIYTLDVANQRIIDGFTDGSGITDDSVYNYVSDPKKLYTKDDTKHSPIIGYAFDGYPIYGPYAFEDPTGNNKNIIRTMKSSYQLRTTLREDGSERDGRYVEDYEYVKGSGDLDEFNARYCHTPEYPGGTYAYFVTVDSNNVDNPVYPYIVGPQYFGEPESANGNFTLPSTGVEDATAEANIGQGKVREIIVTNPGAGYITSPNVTIVGGGNITKQAIGYANLENNKIRINTVNMKFDRIANSKVIQTQEATDTFTATEGQIKFKLTYLPTLDKRDIDIVINDASLYISDFDVSIVTTTDKTYKKKEGYLIFLTPPGKNAQVTVTYKKSIELMQATDRIDYYYQPTAGMLGKDPAQLMTGVEYEGVQVQGLEFDISVGFDGLPWFSHGWDTFSGTNTDYAFRADGSTQTFTLPYVPESLQEINVYFDGVRQDPNNTPTIVGDGSNDTFTLDVGAPDGTLVVFRQKESDGSLVPTDVNNLDTLLSGGTFSTSNGRFNTAIGTNPEEISLDGDGFVTPDTSHAPEEVVPGQCFDTIAINVYNAPSDGSPIIETIRYFGNSLKREYTFNLLPGTLDSVFVTVAGEYLVNGTDYTVDIQNKTVTFVDAPEVGELVTIQTLNIGGSDIVERQTFTGDNSTTEFAMTASYNDVKSAFVTVDGIVKDYVLRESDTGSVIIDIVNPPPASNSVIQIVALGTGDKTVSEIKTDIMEYDGSSTTYRLSQLPGNIAPYHAMAIVELNGERLIAPDTIYYTSNGVTNSYSISQDPGYELFTLSLGEFEVHLNGAKLSAIRDYNFDTATNLITFNTGVLNAGDAIAVTILRNHEYEIYTEIDETDSTTYGYVKVLHPIPANAEIKVTTFTNHDANLLRKEVFNRQAGGMYQLSRPVLDSNYVWVELDRKALVADRDYKILDNNSYIQLDDKFNDSTESKVVVFSFSDNVSSDPIGFTLFEDMLQRRHYKRISKENTTTLTQDLNLLDKEIYVSDASVLVNPSPADRIPGVLFVDKERIEYYVKDGNTLKQITRGTLGTGSKSVHKSGTKVYDAGPDQTIPYTDRINKYEIIIREGLPNGKQVHVLDTINFSSSADAHNQVEVYVGGRKLQKPTVTNNPIKKHDVEIAFDSDETNSVGTSSDVTQIPEFIIEPVDDSDAKGYYKLVLRDVPQVGTELKVIQKQGNIWYENGVSTASNGEPLQRSRTKEAQFLLERSSGLPVINIRE